ncbi:MAG: UvrD-helicase domain-containing protein [Tannerellaceae bacterium]|jgi:DNA helicase-2/ATP-dependent DNA helicase PcrA|nr:UvrD-helicase domain-containing protein [Tannerellaceae bacterium]
MEEYLSQLNEAQREAVLYTGGPEMIIAGAGSGKTRVLTCKIAYLMQIGVPPESIMALTFTNKAAREMKERIAALAGQREARRLWMGTFHSIFSRILRAESDRLGYPASFTIYDSDDSKSLLKSIVKDMSLDDKTYRPGMVHSRISNAKNSLITWKSYEQNKTLVESDIKTRTPMIRDIYKVYQNRCYQAGAMDFDDLLLQTNILFRDHPDVLDKYRRFFKYFLVDEYQDTNFAQHLIVSRLSETHRQICVVGDDAQSIYSFRGANIDNILNFKSQYAGCRTFKLERNYRSTQTIVNAANSLINKNRERISKTIYSEREKGSGILLVSTYSDYEEAFIVASKISEMRMRNQYTYSDFAILYRANKQSRLLEEALRKLNIPYRIYGGLSFYDRKEVKDAVAYLRLIVNPHDEEALKRIINYPARGIGDTTVGKLTSAATRHNLSVWTILKDPHAYDVQLNAGAIRKIDGFRQTIEDSIEYSRDNQADDTALFVLKRAGIVDDFVNEHTIEASSRIENLEELVKGISEYISIRREEYADEDGEHITLAGFLAEASLQTDQDRDKNTDADRVTLMTVHAAKGLEFKNVFVTGMEENLFPTLRSVDSPRAIEEERRLFYVAITRAEENCVLTYAQSRFINGQTERCSPSRFLLDIDARYLHTSGKLSDYDVRPKASTYYQSQPFPSRPQTRSATVETSAVEPVDAASLRIGVTVKHDRFGTGTVTDIEGEGANTKATVEFDNFGQKQLLLKYARLTVL